MNRLPDPHQPTAHQAGQPHPTADDIAEALRRSVDQTMHDANLAIAREQTPHLATFYKNTDPVPHKGTAPPVAQPGRPAMSQGATDISVLMLAGGAGMALLGVGVSMVMLASHYANLGVCAVVFGAPVAFALALARVLKRTAGVVAAAPAPVEIHQHYTGHVHQEHHEITSTTKGLIATTRNEHPDPRP
ncbi:hypothetical protein ABZ829_27820 [Streptomyces xanthochromogenes]|uniref:hypothetical protein n=1 Tax=Streptomyces xanthochromogenes TaxID=67384 RepID=UPI00341A5AB1